MRTRRRRQGQARHARLDGELGRQAQRAAHATPSRASTRRAGARTASTCRSSPRAARTSDPDQLWLLDRARRRSEPAHGIQRRRRRLRMVARRQAARADRRGRGSAPRRRRARRTRRRRRSSSTATTSRKTRPATSARSASISICSTSRRRKAEILTPGGSTKAGPRGRPTARRSRSSASAAAIRTATTSSGSTSSQRSPARRRGWSRTFQGDSGRLLVDERRRAGVPTGARSRSSPRGDPKLIYYSTHHLAVVSARRAATPRILTRSLDRNVLSRSGRATAARSTSWSKTIAISISRASNARQQQVERLVEGRRETTAFDVGAQRAHRRARRHRRSAGRSVRARRPQRCAALTHHNDEWLASVKLGTDRGDLATPPRTARASTASSSSRPAIVAGPSLSDAAVDPRRPGLAVRQLVLDELADLRLARLRRASAPIRAAARAAAKSSRKRSTRTGATRTRKTCSPRSTSPCSRASPIRGRLGVGGWSYGGILTNFVIARDTRFKSATSGASIVNVLAGYGTDMYVREYEAELGTPWKNLDVWLRNSYPFLHADRIKTPTLFQCGDQRFQRAAAEFRADVPGAAQPGRRYAAGHLSGPVPRPDASRATCATACSATSTGTASTCRERAGVQAEHEAITTACRPAPPFITNCDALERRACPRADRRLTAMMSADRPAAIAPVCSFMPSASAPFDRRGLHRLHRRHAVSNHVGELLRVVAVR